MDHTNANVEAAAHNAVQAERLLEEAGKHKLQSQRGNALLWRAGVHATLAVYYQGASR